MIGNNIIWPTLFLLTCFYLYIVSLLSLSGYKLLIYIIGKVPDIKYTENTTHRDCFANPAVRFPMLKTNDRRYTTSCTTRKKGVTGIGKFYIRAQLFKINDIII